MVLGKRQSIRRTTSMTEFAADSVVSDAEATQTHPDQHNLGGGLINRLPVHNRSAGAADWLGARYQERHNLAPTQQGVGHRRNSADLAAVEAAHFLRECGLCKSLLGPGRDIFMYRGEAFCTFECRQQHMKHDERKDKCSMASIKESTAPAANGNEQSGNGETLAAV
ncbi:FCS-Like Zinc finger 6-like [Curcuma longa]|uniref:FCS-Like Zinc finger 6-like n=1 Tax=Curcuma longa TaxID=136217 RepID=UPI003D9EA6AE